MSNTHGSLSINSDNIFPIIKKTKQKRVERKAFRSFLLITFPPFVFVSCEINSLAILTIIVTQQPG